MKITLLIKAWLVLVIGLATLPPSALAAATRVAVIPFQINADKDYTFLQKGIVDMLSSRLSSATVEVIDPLTTAKVLEEVKEFKGESMVLMAGAKLKADFAVFGSLTVLGGSVSIDAKMLDITGTRPPMSFFKQTQGMDEVIPQINRLATEINTTVLGRPAPVAQQAPMPLPAARTPGFQEDIHAHPEKLLQNGRMAPESSGTPLAVSPLNPAFESTQATGMGTKDGDFWKSRNFKFLINGMDMGDVNHDGLIETVLVTPHEIYIYQFSQGRMQQTAKIETSGTYNIGVDVGDINGNGTPEIFITSFNTRHTILDSQVLEYDGQTLKPIVKEARWYFRVVQHPVRGAILLGQRQKAGGADPLSSQIYEMTWQGGRYTEGTRVLPARKANLMGVSYGDILNDKTDTLLGYNDSDKLRLYALNGEEIWTSADYYGGSPIFFALPPDGPGDLQRSFFLPVRTRLEDLDGDQKNEALVVQNIDSAGRKISQQRFYESSRISALAWDGLGLAPKWQTRKISGRIQDLVVADFDNDGRKEIVAAVVSKEGSIIGTQPQSAIIAYELNQ